MSVASLEDRGEAELGRLYILMGEIFRGGLAGTLAGVLFLGAGSRVVMRISALLNPEARGVITENENIVGDITLGGTLGLVIFIGIFGGLVVGTVWVVVRGWLPDDLPRRLPLAALLTAATGSFAVVAADNHDFRTLNPPGLHVAMFVAIVGLAGAATAGLDRLLEGRVPTAKGVVAVFGGMAGIGLVFAAPFLAALFFLGAAGGAPPWPAGLALIAATVATVAGWARYYSEGDAGLATRPVWQWRLGVGSVALFGLLGAAHLAREINAIV